MWNNYSMLDTEKYPVNRRKKLTIEGREREREREREKEGEGERGATNHT
jgi:hypothetical protein